ncbi:MAG: hypothetical protein K0B06_12190, partial [Brevefilum sp.]|nr:hypothetical protein [Brevefilum sp.]
KQSGTPGAKRRWAESVAREGDRTINRCENGGMDFTSRPTKERFRLGGWFRRVRSGFDRTINRCENGGMNFTSRPTKD